MNGEERKLTDDSEEEHHYSITEEFEITGRWEEVRRHLAEDVFDSTLPILGIIMAGIILEQTRNVFLVYEAILLAAIGSGVAHLISGFGATYLTESAEGRRLIEKLIQDKSKHLTKEEAIRMERETTLLLSTFKGILPFISVFVTIFPMFLPLFGMLSFLDSMIFSLIMGMIILGLVGIYLGKLGGTSVTISAIKTIAAGVMTLIILTIVSLLTGLT